MAETHSNVTSDTSAQDSKQDERSLRALVTIVATVVVIVFVLLLWQVATQGRDAAFFGAPQIAEVEGLDELDGSIAVWLRPDASIVEVLERNGLAGNRHTHLGEGTYIIETTDENENDIVRRLGKDPAIWDAGFIYAE